MLNAQEQADVVAALLRLAGTLTGAEMPAAQLAGYLEALDDREAEDVLMAISLLLKRWQNGWLPKPADIREIIREEGPPRSKHQNLFKPTKPNAASCQSV